MSTSLFSLFCFFSLTEEANLFMCQGFARFIFHQTPPANLLASCHQPGDTLLGVLKASQSHDPCRRCARSTRWVNMTHGHATRLSLWQRCHSQDKSPSISTGSKGIMVLGKRGRGEARRTKYQSWSYHLWLRDQPLWVCNTGQSKKRGRLLLLPPMLWLLHHARGGGKVSHTNTQERGEEEKEEESPWRPLP